MNVLLSVKLSQRRPRIIGRGILYRHYLAKLLGLKHVKILVLHRQLLVPIGLGFGFEIGAPGHLRFNFKI